MKWLELNNKIISGDTVNIQYDQEALTAYFEEKVNPNTVFFHDLEEKIEYMVRNNFWDSNILIHKWTFEEVKQVFERAYALKFRFKSFMGAYKFYNEYATRTPDGSRWLERYEDRQAVVALTHANGIENALYMVEHLVHQTFTPATPTLLNSGKANSGRLVSCFLLQDMTDNLPSIMNTLSFIADLSKGGGGIGVDASNLRAKNESLRNIDNVTKGVVGVAKMADNVLRYADQAGQRLGAGVFYLSVMHPDIQELLASKKPAVDEDKRLKTLSVGVTIPDVFMTKLKNDEDIYQFYPNSLFKETGRMFTDINWTEEYEVLAANDNIRKKKVSARKIYEEIAITQGESGYPYLLYIDNANAKNPLKNVGTIKMSNLCSEILQTSLPSTYNTYNKASEDVIGLDISCNLASLVIKNTMEHAARNLRGLEPVVSTAIDLLDSVSRSTNIEEVPAVKKANDTIRSIGLGAMGLHSYLALNEIYYGSDEALDFVDVFFASVHYYARKRSMEIARDTGFVFEGFEGSEYQNGNHFKQYFEGEFSPKTERVRELFENIYIPTSSDWKELYEDIKRYGLAHGYISAIAPTGSISYVSNASASIMPITEKVETRTSGKGKTIYPMPDLNSDTEWFYEDAYSMDQERVIDTVATAQKHIDQGISCTLFIPSTLTTRGLQKYYLYAYKNGLKTLYYTRTKKLTIDECLSCAI